MARKNTKPIRIDIKLAEAIRDIQEKTNKDLGVKISTAQASRILAKNLEEIRLNIKMRKIKF